VSARRHTVTLVAGDGVGPEVTDAVVRILAAAAVPLDWEPAPAGAAALARHGSALPPALLASIRRTRIALKAHLTAPPGAAAENPNVALRKALDLYANVRPVRPFPGRPSRHPDLDLVIVRENTEGEYAGLEHQVVPGVVESIKVTTEAACTRIARFAFAYAARAGRKQVTAVHKANIMKLSDGLFLETCRRAAAEHPAIAYRELIVDNTCMQLVMNPRQFDVMVTQNFYGDLISDLCAGLAGGFGVVPGVSRGDEIAVFEAIHAEDAELAGTDRASPLPLLVSALLMLRHLDLGAHADRITAATGAALLDAPGAVPATGGAAGTRALADAIIARLR
jgi:isocitrate dehydrogenase (NAD+)